MIITWEPPGKSGLTPTLLRRELLSLCNNSITSIIPELTYFPQRPLYILIFSDTIYTFLPLTNFLSEYYMMIL